MQNNLDNPLYYLENFRFVLDWVNTRYHDLLDRSEHELIEQFSALPTPAAALLVRMVMRRGELFRISRLQYPEIGNCNAALKPLLDLGWIELDPVLDLAQLYGVLTRAEFAQSLQLKATGSARKTDLYQQALLQGRAACRFSEWVVLLPDQLVALRIRPLSDRLRLMFFGNLYQDWSEFVLADLGIYAYETVEFSDDSRAFSTRAAIDYSMQLHGWRQAWHDSTGQDEPSDQLALMARLEYQLLQTPAPNVWLQEKANRLLFRIGQRLEQLQAFPAALRVYAVCHYPGARARRIRVLEKCAEFAAALHLAEAARQSWESAAEQQQVSRILPRLQKKLGLTRTTAPALLAAETVLLQLSEPADGTPVEHLVLEHLALCDPGAQVFYVENAMINSLFGLLCWEAIFLPLPGAFFHPFQGGPADLHSADFFQRRAAAFQNCLDRLNDSGWRDTIRTNFSEKQGLQSPFVYWTLLDAALLELALQCIPAQHLRLWCERILEDVAAHRNGFPDLICFWPAEQRYQMIEVKGPGDRLQDNQLRLIDFALQHQMPVAVCYVEWACE